MISHQKLIILFNNKKTLYQFKVFFQSMLLIFLLQEHIRDMKCDECFFYHVFFYDFISLQLQLGVDFK